MEHKTKKIIIIFFLILFFSVFGLAKSSEAATCNATVERASVQSCVSSASPGDTINISSGTSAAWSSPISINIPLTIVGAGGTNSHLTGTAGFFDISLATTSLMRISRLYMDLGTNYANHQVAVGGDISQLRVDNNRFDAGQSAVNLVGYIRGVIDSNYFFNNDISIQFLGGSEAQGSASWERPIVAGMNMGTGTVYAEGNTFVKNFSCRDQNNNVESGQGGTFVIRYNTFDGSNFCRSDNNYPYYAIMYHGNGSTSGACATDLRGHPIVETYNNLIQGGRLADIILRGGSQIVHDNVMTYTVYNPGIILRQECGNSWPAGDQIFNSFIWNNKANGSAMPIGYADSYSQTVIQPNRDYRTTIPKSAASCVAGGTCGLETLSGPVHGLSGMTSTSSGDNAYYPYVPYTCPHPLTGYAGSCDSDVAGVAGYNVSNSDTTPPASPTGLSVS